ncbi:MAG: alpha/beta hydrolase [Micrococcales bacterium]|nr:alpha/beta hydrolase [Micrococcales bacterium]
MDRAGRRVARVQAAAVVMCAALGLAGCSTSADDAATKGTPGLEKYYSQALDWKDCSKQPGFSSGRQGVDGLDKLECTWLTVPMDYANPSGETIKLALARSTAENSQGSIVINPGGPGGSGVDVVAAFVDGLGDRSRDVLDVVGFDPRGVGRSAPVDCLSDDDLNVFLTTDIDTTSEEGIAQAEAAVAEFAEGCLELTGSLLEHVDTISAARDMDVIRAALGESTLNYLGVSYGTQLGATYAALFPDRVGRMVLDAAVDPTALDETTVIQAGGFESALRAYVTDCLASDGCPLSGSVDEAMDQVVAVVEQATDQPLSIGDLKVLETLFRELVDLDAETAALVAVEVVGGLGDRQLTGALALTGIFTALYSQDAWEQLTMALRFAIDNQDGTMLMLLADTYLQRCDGLTCPVEDGYYSNMMEAHTAIGCADNRKTRDADAMAAEAEQIRQVAPHLAEYFISEVDECADWPTPVTESLRSYAAKGAPPIVVIGTTNDPATPYQWAQALAEMLDSGVLVTYEGEGHGAYLRGVKCIQTAVDDFLVDGKVPEDGLTCSAS